MHDGRLHGGPFQIIELGGGCLLGTVDIIIMCNQTGASLKNIICTLSIGYSFIQDGPPWGSAILILRNPRDALVAEWSRRLTLVQTYLKHTHVQEFGSEYFGKCLCEHIIL